MAKLQDIDKFLEQLEQVFRGQASEQSLLHTETLLQQFERVFGGLVSLSRRLEQVFCAQVWGQISSKQESCYSNSNKYFVANP